jgi:hypothetical protein
MNRKVRILVTNIAMGPENDQELEHSCGNGFSIRDHTGRERLRGKDLFVGYNVAATNWSW